VSEKSEERRAKREEGRGKSEKRKAKREEGRGKREAKSVAKRSEGRSGPRKGWERD
jgi:hypothetical protein